MPVSYTPTQWVLIFFIFCFLGWIFESSYVSLHERRPVNRGFLYGPWIPLYGSGGVIMLFLALPFSSMPPLVFLIGLLGATALEYAVGVIMESLFRIRYWDYTGKPFASKNGYISLPSSLCWGVFTLLLVYLGAPRINRFIFHFSGQAASLLAAFLTLLFGIDTAFSVKAALHLRSLLQVLSSITEELRSLQSEFAGHLDRVRQSTEEAARAVQARLDEHLEELGSQLDTHRTRLEIAAAYLSADFDESFKDLKDERILRLRRRAKELETRREQMLAKLDFLDLMTLKGNPSASSKFCGFACMKERVETKLRKRIDSHRH